MTSIQEVSESDVRGKSGAKGIINASVYTVEATTRIAQAIVERRGFETKTCPLD